MNLLKSEIKQAVANEIGSKVEDSLEAARKEVASMEGRQVAFLDAASLVSDAVRSIQREIDAGQISLEQGTATIGHMKKLADALRNQASNANSMRSMAIGKAQGIEQAVKLISNIVEAEKARAEAAKKKAEAASPAGLVEAGPTSVPQAAVHRFTSIKEQRLAEEGRARLERSESPAVSEQEQPREATAQPKRRGRKPRASNS